jgi:hypothetical protein
MGVQIASQAVPAPPPFPAPLASTGPAPPSGRSSPRPLLRNRPTSPTPPTTAPRSGSKTMARSRLNSSRARACLTRAGLLRLAGHRQGLPTRSRPVPSWPSMRQPGRAPSHVAIPLRWRGGRARRRRAGGATTGRGWGRSPRTYRRRATGCECPTCGRSPAAVGCRRGREETSSRRVAVRAASTCRARFAPPAARALWGWREVSPAEVFSKSPRSVPRTEPPGTLQVP